MYAVPFDKPDTVIGLDEPVPVNPPGELVTVYPVIGSLLKLDAVNVTEAEPALAVAVPIVGAVGEPLVEPDDELRIGICVFYLILFLPIVDLTRT